MPLSLGYITRAAAAAAAESEREELGKWENHNSIHDDAEHDFSARVCACVCVCVGLRVYMYTYITLLVLEAVACRIQEASI